MSDISNGPIVLRLEIESIRHQVMHAFTQHAHGVSEMIDEGVKKICHPDHIGSVIEDAAASVVREAIREELRNFFRFGAGRDVIREAIVSTLSLKADEEEARRG